MIIYLAGPYTHPEESVRNQRAEALTRIAAELMQDGHIIFSPITHGHSVTQHLPPERACDKAFWMSQCIPMLSVCTKLVVVMLPGWVESTGVQHEIDVATQQGMQILYIQEPSS